MSYYRYPGPFPFQTQDQHIFFGREREVDRFITLLNVEKLIVLYAKSGLGKSSLVNAGVMPKLKNLPKYYKDLRIRLLSYNDDSSAHITTYSPLQTLIGELNIQAHQNFLDNTDAKKSLWLALKMMQSEAPNRKGALVLFFDQFEEFFDYPKIQQDEFKQAIAELFRSTPPEEIEQAIQNEEDNLTEEQINFLYTPLDVRIVFLIRSDRMSYMDSMKDYIPSILNTTFDIKPLNKEQASEAIDKPAKKIGNFQTPPFLYSQEAIEDILSFIADDKGHYEPYQIQLICSRLERKILKEDNFVNGHVIQKEYLGNLQSLIEGVYLEAVNTLASEDLQKQARILIETKLLKNGKRKSLDQDDCGLPIEILEALEDERILRREVNHLGNATYEVAHDTFIEPIERLRKDREHRENEEAKNLSIQRELEIAKQKLEVSQLERKKEKKKAWMLAILVTTVIIVVSGLAIWVMIERRRFNEAQLKLQIENGDDAFQETLYPQAVRFYESALEIHAGDDSVKMEVRNKKEEAEERGRNEPLFNRLMAEADSLRKAKELNLALSKYKEARRTNYNIASASMLIIEVNKEIDELFEKKIEEAEGFREAGEAKWFEKALKEASKLKPNDEKIKRLLNQ